MPEDEEGDGKDWVIVGPFPLAKVVIVVAELGAAEVLTDEIEV